MYPLYKQGNWFVYTPDTFKQKELTSHLTPEVTIISMFAGNDYIHWVCHIILKRSLSFIVRKHIPGEYKSGFVEGISDFTQWGATQLVSWHVLTWVSIEPYIINSTSD